MKSTSWKDVVEMVGMVAIIVSLLFLGYEVKRANDIAEAQATSTVYQGGNEFLLAFIDNQNLRHVMRNTFWGGSESLTDDDQMLLTATMTYIYNINEVAWKYHQKGLMSDADMSVRFAELCVWINGSPAVAKDWASRRDTVLPGFYDDASRECKIANE